jgi:hypothetical protein
MKVQAKPRTIIHETPDRCKAEEHHFISEELRQKIEKKAYELYKERGGGPGRDVEDWLEAEKMLNEGKG